MISKEASAKVRSVEALIGAATGGTLGAGVGYGTYKPKTPRSILDAQGRQSKRELTEDEKKSRKTRIGKAALVSAAAGMGGSLTASVVRRAAQGAGDLKNKDDIIEAFLGPLKSHIKEMKSVPQKANDALFVPKDSGAASYGRARRIEEGEKLLKKYEAAVKDAPESARKFRDSKLFGGSFYLVPKGKKVSKDTPKMPSRGTTEGQIIRALFKGPRGLDAVMQGPDHLAGHYRRIVGRNADLHRKV